MTSTMSTDVALAQSGAVGNDAQSIINQVLGDYGLQSLTSWAWNEITSGASSSQVLLDMYQTPQFQQRFPGIQARQQAGLPAISPSDYVNYENSLAQMESQYGLPQGFLTNPTTVANFIGQDISTNEVQARVQQGFDAVAYSPPEVRQAFSAYFGANGNGALASYFLDSSKSLPLLTQQATAAQIGGVAAMGSISLSSEDAMKLASLGVTEDQASNGFQNLEQRAPLFEASVTEQPGLTEGNQGVASQFGLDQNATQQVIQRQQQREAEFAGDTSPAEINTYGAPGAGSARPV